MDPSLLLALTLETADFAQTETIARNPTIYHEYNPILGHHPSPAKVAGYFLAAEGAQVLLNVTLPPEYAHALNWATVGFEAGIVAHNAHLGIKLTF